MPVIEVHLEELCRLTGLTRDEIIELLPYIGVDLERIGEDTVKIEYTPNRPDYATTYGLAAAIRGLTGKELGAPAITRKLSSFVVVTDDSVRRVRPYIVGLIARNLRLTDDTIKQLIRIQEDLHEGLGRKRSKVAIGFHDADRVSPPVRYTTVNADYRFVPLGEREEWSVQEILDKHPVGIRYGGIIRRYGVYPILIDNKGHVLSLPPIINGEHTRVTTSTKNLFVDITGTDMGRVMDTAAILAFTLSEIGARLETVSVKYGDTVEIQSPDIASREMHISVSMVNNLLGVRFAAEEVATYLRKARLDAETVGEDLVRVRVPRYRSDIMHYVDIVEEVAYGYGFYNLKPSFDLSYSAGRKLQKTLFEEHVRSIITGLGFLEVVTTHLTSYYKLYISVDREPRRPLKVLSTKSSEHEYLRDSLLPGIFWVLASNTHEEYPQRIFEIGSIFVHDEKTKTIKEETRIAFATAHSQANFTEIKSVTEALITALTGSKATYDETTAPYFIDGRAAALKLNGQPLGVTGEIHPRVLTKLGLQVPVAAAELRLDTLLELCMGANKDKLYLVDKS